MIKTNDKLTTEQAIDELFQLYADDLYRFSLHSVGNPTDAKDIVQEVFIRAFQGWNTFRHESNPKTWLFHIARNYIYDQFRKKRSMSKFIQQEKQNSKTTSYYMDNTVELEEALLHLNLNYRNVLILRFIEDLNVEQTSEILNWSQSKVRTTQHRALKRLKTIFQKTTHQYHSSV